MSDLYVSEHALRTVEGTLSTLASELNARSKFTDCMSAVQSAMPGVDQPACVSDASEAVRKKIKMLSTRADETSDDCDFVLRDFQHVDEAFAEAFDVQREV